MGALKAMPSFFTKSTSFGGGCLIFTLYYPKFTKFNVFYTLSKFAEKSPAQRAVARALQLTF